MKYLRGQEYYGAVATPGKYNGIQAHNKDI